MKIVVVTGCTGMDGSNMVDYLLANTNYLIVGIARHSSNPNRQNLREALNSRRFNLMSGDLTDAMTINELVRNLNPDYWINFGGQSSVAESWTSPETTFDVNALGVLKCLEAIKNFCPKCRFFSAGSSEEFGQAVFSPQTLDHPVLPRSPYGASKAAARNLVKIYRETHGLYAVHGIMYNHEGVRRGDEFVTRKITKGVARLLYEAVSEAAPIELGNLDACRDWSDSEDFMDGVWRMLNQDDFRPDLQKKWDGTGKLLIPQSANIEHTRFLSKEIKEYILASGECHTVREFIEVAFEYAGIRGRWWNGTNAPEDEEFILNVTSKRIPLVVVNQKFYRKSEPQSLIGDSSLIRRDLQWSPKTSFQDLVKKMVSNDI